MNPKPSHTENLIGAVVLSFFVGIIAGTYAGHTVKCKAPAQAQFIPTFDAPIAHPSSTRYELINDHYRQQQQEKQFNSKIQDLEMQIQILERDIGDLYFDPEF